jgi:mannosyltransferase
VTLTVPPGTRPAPGRATSGPRRPWWPCLPPAALLALLGGALVRQRRGLWYDELYTAEVGTAGLSALARAVWTGTGTTSYLADVPPSYNAPYYAVVHLWLGVTRLPADELGLRLLSLLAAVGAVAVLVRAVQRLAGTAVALAAGLLAASSPLVVEYSAEARMYGLALLAVATTALGLSRWLDAAPRGLLLLGLGGGAAGLLHWFALPVVAGLVLSALVLRGRAALPVAAVGALAAVPSLALVGLSRLNGTGTSAAGWIRESEAPVPVLALQAWTGGHTVLLTLLLLALAAGLVTAVRRDGARPLAVLAVCWTVVPLVVVQVAELVRPVFVPRYLLPALLGVALLAALGTASWRRAAAVPATAALVAASLLATLPLLDRGPREDGRAAVAALAQQHAPGEVVVAVDRRAALALEHYGDADVLADLRVPPADPPAGAEVVWLLRQSTGERVRPSDDDELLRADGLSTVGERVFPGTSSDLVLQRWER